MEIPDTLADFPWFIPGEKVRYLNDDAAMMGIEQGKIYTVAERSRDGWFYLVECPDDDFGFGRDGFEKVRVEEEKNGQ